MVNMHGKHNTFQTGRTRAVDEASGHGGALRLKCLRSCVTCVFFLIFRLLRMSESRVGNAL